MGIQIQDFRILSDLHRRDNFGKKCAILGDCNFYYNGNNLKEFSNFFGFDLVETFDLYGNPTHRMDLQNPIPEDLWNKYDLVIDAGTIYCIFDVCGVMKNVFRMLKEGGKVVHISNLSGHYGRAFYSIHPSFFNDFYSVNNFRTIYSGYRTKFNNSDYVQFNLDKNYVSGVTETEFVWSDDNFLVKWIHNDSLILTCHEKTSDSVDFKKVVPLHYIKTNGK